MSSSFSKFGSGSQSQSRGIAFDDSDDDDDEGVKQNGNASVNALTSLTETPSFVHWCSTIRSKAPAHGDDPWATVVNLRGWLGKVWMSQVLHRSAFLMVDLASEDDEMVQIVFSEMLVIITTLSGLKRAFCLFLWCSESSKEMMQLFNWGLLL